MGSRLDVEARPTRAEEPRRTICYPGGHSGRIQRRIGSMDRRRLLEPCERPEGGIIPLLAVHHTVKNKVRPVLDYRELNGAVQSHTADCEVCPETLRRWRVMGDRLGVVDLKNAYLAARASGTVGVSGCSSWRSTLPPDEARLRPDVCAEDYGSGGEAHTCVRF